MVAKSIANAVFVHVLVLTLMAAVTSTISTDTDIACLKSIKASLQDPFRYLESSWDFNNNTEGFICRFVGVECWHPDENRVLNLRLSDMGLKGKFPAGIHNCTALTGLDLSNNHLWGPIPFGIDKMIPFITTLDISYNNFSGEIPSTLANCSHLHALKLNHNRLTGQIPPELGFLDRIKEFSVASNRLSGPVPNFFHNVSISGDSFANNMGLCGAPLETCGGSYNEWKVWKWRFDYSVYAGFAIGYTVFIVSTLVVYASYCVPWVYIGNKNQMMTIPEMVFFMWRKYKSKYAEIDQFATLSTLEFLLEKEVCSSENFITRVKFKDLLKATENFSRDNVVGFGETGTVYKATLPNGWSLAVKKFCNSQNSEEQFITELKILGKLRHHNIVPLIGFCKESKKRLLIYNYASNGNLSDWLHSGDDKKKKILTWPVRMKIAVGLARGLAWLHHCSDFRVAHLHVSSKSVLLDKKFEPKLSNFGMATLVDPNEIDDSSRGFVMDMEFWEQCFVKEDVFNFGVVLHELITGEKSTENGSIDDVLIGEGCELEMLECIKIAEKCIQPFPEQRPTMLDVYTRLSIIRDRYGH